jgi:peptide/nickel transport system permease protein
MNVRPRAGPIALGALAIVALIALAAPILGLRDPLHQDIAQRLLPPDSHHWLGTDSLGRDELSRIVYGARTSFGAILLVALLMLPPGLLLGMIAGYVGGWVERSLVALMNLALAFPPLILALAFVGFLGVGIVNAAVALALTGWPVYGRLALAETRLLRQTDYIAAAEMQGIVGLRLLWGHLLPACLPAAQVRLAFDLGATILAIAALGYLGLGARPPTPEWGELIAEGSRSGLEYWWLAVFPGAAIFLASLAFNLVADSWRDRRDPRHA